MTTPQPDTYAPLAPIYDDAGFSQFAASLAPELLTFVQQQQALDWLGRRVLDLGCGTGASTAFFATRNLEATGVDNSPAMLEAARFRSQGTGYHVKFLEGDLATMEYPTGQDLIFCLGNVLNELRSLRDIEMVFTKAAAALSPKKVFIFDMTTLYGLGEEIGSSQLVLDISDRIFLAVENNFNYDNMALKQRLSIFTRAKSEPQWKRSQTYLTLRGFPYVTIARLAEKAGLTIYGAYDVDLKRIDPQTESVGKFIVIAYKKA